MNIKKCHDIKVIRNIAMFRIIMRHCFAIYISVVLFSIAYRILSHQDFFSDQISCTRLFINEERDLWFLYVLFFPYILSYSISGILRNLTKGIPVIIPSFIIKKHLYFRITHNCTTYITIFTPLVLLKGIEYTTLISDQHLRPQYFQHWLFRFLIGSLSIHLIFSLPPLTLSKNKFLENISSLSYKLYIIHQFILLGLLYSATSLLEGLYQRTIWLFPLSISYCLHNKPTTVFPPSKASYTKASLDPTIYDYSDTTYHQ